MKLIVGIGNPGKEYDKTRHNVGFIILDNFVQNGTWRKDKDGEIWETVIGGEKVLFLKPLTYVNLSGNAVYRVANYYKIPNEDILVVHDDLDLKSMTYRLKYNSSSGGHNGIKSIINCLNGQNFSQLKVGISNDKGKDTRDYVLSKLSKEEIEYLSSERFKKIIISFVIDGIERTMNKYNSNEG